MAHLAPPDDAKQSAKEKFQPRSSFLENAEYDSKSDTMTLTFKTGSQFTYHNVGESTWLSFKQSADHSSYYARVIKGRLSATPVVRSIVGKPKSAPLKKLKQERTLTHGNIPSAGLGGTLERAGLIPDGLHR